MMRVNSVSLFKSGIKPAWEDPVNTNGGDFAWRFSDMASDIREIWRHMVEEIVCQDFHELDNITGIRAVDKSQNGKLSYKLEIWTKFSDENSEEGKKLRAYITDKFINKDPSGKPDSVLNFSPHKDDGKKKTYDNKDRHNNNRGYDQQRPQHTV
jgi:hypothetical protein